MRGLKIGIKMPMAITLLGALVKASKVCGGKRMSSCEETTAERGWWPPRLTDAQLSKTSQKGPGSWKGTHPLPFKLLSLVITHESPHQYVHSKPTMP